MKALVDAGYRELVISGINLGRWGRDFVSSGHVIPRRESDEESGVRWSTAKPRSLASLGMTRKEYSLSLRFEHLVQEILGQTSLEKLRISSVEPMDWSDELIQMMAESPRIAKHAHVPMQSGSDRVLRAMHRKYRPWHYREKIEKIRDAMPTAAIGADVMVGFPGEEDDDFDETVRMVEALPFTYLHVFTYSPRPGTPAAAMRNHVPVQVARERNRILRELAAEKKLAFMRSFLGRTVEAITLQSSRSLSSRAEVDDFRSNQSGGVEGPAVFTEALTDNYLKLRVEGRYAPNHWLTAQVAQVECGTLFGTLN